jgi:phosphopentomutase
MPLRALLVVLDSVGVGHAPDASAYGDADANTLGHIIEQRPATRLPALEALGLRASLDLAAGRDPERLPVRGAVGVLTERSAGKDTTTGHWELAGVITEEPFAVFERFPEELVRAIELEGGVEFIGNRAASGTAILDELGPEHIGTGKPILYTSADSVLQIAAHEEVIPPRRLYAICEAARRHADRFRIGRVIARPFVGRDGRFQRTANRHDFSLVPPRTVLNALAEAGVATIGVGKIGDIFAGNGIAASRPTKSNGDGTQLIEELWSNSTNRLIFANLVDFDTLYGHRRDAAGYARALEEFDSWLGGFLPRAGDGDLVMITADHGNDPTSAGTDHTRERVPVFVIGRGLAGSLGIRGTFADVAATLADWFGLSGGWPPGLSMLSGNRGLPSDRTEGLQA